jgi:hypothetical protein
VAAEIATSARGQFVVNQNGVEEMVIDKGYHALRYCGNAASGRRNRLRISLKPGWTATPMCVVGRRYNDPRSHDLLHRVGLGQ